ncbi:MAG TPA: hypothetical protein VKZ75_04395 [Cyclobacteriaceae bacterium]|nr:hypothetical protein [Cyclobacteriaceae bacterium]
MKKRRHALTEHYLVPAVLFLLNICLVHLISVLVAGPAYAPATKMALGVTLVLLGSSLLFKKRILLTGSIFFYALVVIWF